MGLQRVGYMERRLVCLLYVVKNACVFYRLAESVDSTVGRFNLHGIVLWECVRLFLAFCTSVNKWMYYLLWLVCRVSYLCMNIARFCVSHDHQCTRCTRPTNWHSYVVAKSSCLLYAFELQNCREKPKKTLHNIYNAMGILFNMHYIKGCNMYSLYFCRSHMLTLPYTFSQLKCYSKTSQMPLMTIQRWLN